MEKKLLQELFNESKQEIRKAGINLSNDIEIKLSDLGKRNFGQCKNKKQVLISYWAYENLSKDKIKNTIIHELLHTLKDTKGHCRKWNLY